MTENDWCGDVAIGMDYQNAADNLPWKPSAVEKNMKNGLMTAVIFDVTVVNFEIDFLEKEGVSEKKKNCSIDKLTMLDSNIAFVP